MSITHYCSFPNTDNLALSSVLVCGFMVVVQEEYIKDEMKNLKRELIRAKEEIKRIQVREGTTKGS